MLRFISDLIVKVFRHRDICIDDELYLRRVYLTPRSWRLRVFLHFIFRGDEGKWLHDHPFDFWSFSLWGKYNEKCMVGVPAEWNLRDSRIYERQHRRFAWIHYPATHRHRAVASKPVVTLCFVKQACREWGFFPDDDDRWVHWREHLGLTPEMQPDYPEDVIGRERE